MNNSIRLKYRKLNDGRIRYCVFYKLTKSNGISFNVRLFYCDVFVTDKTITKISPYLTFSAKTDEFGQLYNGISKHTKLWKMLRKYLAIPIRVMNQYAETKSVDHCQHPDDVYGDICRKTAMRNLDLTDWIFSVARENAPIRDIIKDLIDRLVRRDLCKPIVNASISYSIYSSTNFGTAIRGELDFGESLAKILGFKQ